MPLSRARVSVAVALNLALAGVAAAQPEGEPAAEIVAFTCHADGRAAGEGAAPEVQVELHGTAGRIHLSPALIPPIHSGGADGWWTLQDLNVTPDRIVGAYRLNGMNAPVVDIDRRAGRIFIDGIEDFAGVCEKAGAEEGVG